MRRFCRMGSELGVSAVWVDLLLRKEVIQPHLPIRLPCYDLAPIKDLALGAGFR
jgi:hypothetical protein